MSAPRSTKNNRRRLVTAACLLPAKQLQSDRVALFISSQEAEFLLSDAGALTELDNQLQTAMHHSPTGADNSNNAFVPSLCCIIVSLRCVGLWCVLEEQTEHVTERAASQRRDAVSANNLVENGGRRGREDCGFGDGMF